jgi:hypothetical protein
VSQPLPKRSEHQRLKLIDTLSLCTLPSAHQTERARRVRTLLKPRGKSVHQGERYRHDLLAPGASDNRSRRRCCFLRTAHVHHRHRRLGRVIDHQYYNPSVTDPACCQALQPTD